MNAIIAGRVFEAVLALALLIVFVEIIRYHLSKRRPKVVAKHVAHSASSQLYNDWFFQQVEECRNDFMG